MDAARLSRRRFLAGGTASILPVVAGCLSTASQKAPQIEGWRPPKGSWPLPWYDPQNRSYNPTASPPRRDPTVVQTFDLDRPMRDSLVVDDHLAVYGDGARVFDRTSDDLVWSTDNSVFAAAFGPGDHPGVDRVLYLATEADDDRDAVVSALGFRDGGSESLFDTTIERQNVASVLPTESALFAGTRGVDCFALDPETGNRIAKLRGRHAALHDGNLVTTTYGEVSASETTGLISDSEANPIWQVDDFEGRAYHPAVANGRILVGGFGTAEGSTTGHLHCFDAETGDLLWEPRSFGWATWTPAVAGNVAYVAGNDPGSGTGRVAAVDLTDGSIVWEHDLDWQPIDPIAAGNGVVLVRHDGSSEDEWPGFVEAYDAETGRSLWSFEHETTVRRVRAVGEEIYLLTDVSLSVLGHP